MKPQPKRPPGTPGFWICFEYPTTPGKDVRFDAPVKLRYPDITPRPTTIKPKYDVKAIPDDMLFALADKLQSAEYQKALLEKGGAQ